MHDIIILYIYIHICWQNLWRMYPFFLGPLSALSQVPCGTATARDLAAARLRLKPARPAPASEIPGIRDVVVSPYVIYSDL